MVLQEMLSPSCFKGSNGERKGSAAQIAPLTYPPFCFGRQRGWQLQSSHESHTSKKAVLNLMYYLDLTIASILPTTLESAQSGSLVRPIFS